jgi:hypothetical protein
MAVFNFTRLEAAGVPTHFRRFIAPNRIELALYKRGLSGARMPRREALEQHWREHPAAPEHREPVLDLPSGVPGERVRRIPCWARVRGDRHPHVVDMDMIGREMVVRRTPISLIHQGSTQDLVRVPGWHGHRGGGQELHVQARFLSRFPDGRLCDVLGALDMAAAGQPAFKAGMPDQGSQPRSGLLTEHEHARCRLLDHHASSIGLAARSCLRAAVEGPTSSIEGRRLWASADR